MVQIPAFDGGFVSWCVADAMIAMGAGAVFIGWLNIRLGLTGLGLAAIVAAGVWVAPALSQESAPDLEGLLATAQARADQAQTRLSDWSESLQRRGSSYLGQAADVQTATQGSLPRGAAMLSDPALGASGLAPNGAPEEERGGVYLAVSLSMPPETLRVLARDAHRAGVKVVIRGLIGGSFKATLVRISQVFDDHSQGGVAIDPQVFRAFDVRAVPTFVAAVAPVQPCGPLGCAPKAPAYDKVAGNISLEAALRLLSDEGSAGGQPARAALARLAG